ncbi:MAG: FAD/NAD(P)-binding protein [Planctomycetota bacterium]
MIKTAPLNTELYKPLIATITKVTKLTEKEKIFEIRLSDNRELGHQPGQFVEVTLPGIGEAPISISSSPTAKGGFELGIRAVGNVTKAIHNLEAGASVGIRGPFGRGFPVNELKGRDIIFVAAGIGLFPLRSLINYTLDKRSEFGRIIIFCGAKRVCERIMPDEIAGWTKRTDIECMETVDIGESGWTCNVGVITTLFPKVKVNPKNTSVIVVGPPIMYKYAIQEAKKMGIADEDIIVSLERKMKCGIGKCGHCQINHLYCCMDGPVFRYSEIKNVREAL